MIDSNSTKEHILDNIEQFSRDAYMNNIETLEIYYTGHASQLGGDWIVGDERISLI